MYNKIQACPSIRSDLLYIPEAVDTEDTLLEAVVLLQEAKKI